MSLKTQLIYLRWRLHEKKQENRRLADELRAAKRKLATRTRRRTK